jgi:hypothetical protein
MPCVRIATGAWAAGSEMKLIEAVQSALVAAFRISEGDRDVVLDLHGENRREACPAKLAERGRTGLSNRGPRPSWRAELYPAWRTARATSPQRAKVLESTSLKCEVR